MSSTIIPVLDAARKALRLRQEDLAERTGLSRLTVQRTLNGSVDPRLSTVEEMARGVGMEFMLVPADLRTALENFIRSGGRYLAQPPGTDAPPSAVDLMLREQAKTGEPK